MPRPRRADVRPNPGRPIKPIDWALVDELLMAGCSGTQIAPHFDMHPETFYERCQLEKGMGFTGYSQEKKCKGESILLHKQYKQAVQGNVPLLMFLGKVRLGQKETAEIALSEETTKTFSKVLDQLQACREGKTNAESNNQEPTSEGI